MINYNDVKQYIGDPNQLLTFYEGVLTGGRQEGTTFMEIHNGGNLSATILPGRCMNIYQVRYKGINMNYLTPSGIVSPKYYDTHGNEWLRSFQAGMMATVGLQHIGDPRVLPNGEQLGLHGRIDNTPAENIKWSRGFNHNNPTLHIEGTMREACLCDENLSLHRNLYFEYEKDSIEIIDRITNHGFGRRQVLYGLHLNYGYPLLDEDVKFIINTERVKPKDAESAQHIDSWQYAAPPTFPFCQRVYSHILKQDEKGEVQYTLFNEKRSIGVNVRFDGRSLPRLGHWQLFGKGEYVMGIEPLNTEMDGAKRDEPGCIALTCPLFSHIQNVRNHLKSSVHIHWASYYSMTYAV